MPESTSIPGAGMDVAKHGLDVHILPSGLTSRFPNQPQGRRALRHWLRQQAVTRTVFEAAGRYHRCLHQSLAEAGLETVAADPLRSRRFAQFLDQGRQQRSSRGRPAGPP